MDDVELNRELICEYLAKQPFQLITAENGQSAIELVRKEKPDVVLMDVRMPVMNGIQATEIIKNDSKISDTKVIAITASVVEDENSDKKRSLFDMVLYKPLNRRTLLNSLAKFIESDRISEGGAGEVDFNSLYREEVSSASDSLIRELEKHQKSLEKAKIGGNFNGLDRLLDELQDIANNYKLVGLNKLIEKLKQANKIFDIEETQKIISIILTGIGNLSSR